MFLRKVDRYWQTLRHLRPVQVYGRLWFRIARPQPELSAPPSLRDASGIWLVPAARTPTLTGPGAFLLLAAPGSLDRDGWDSSVRDKLWLYNQHYFDDLNAAGASARQDWHLALIADWIAHNTPGRGCGWEPYPTSLRIVNWVKWAMAGNTLSPEACHSLAIQARWLMRRLEWHLLGNHIFVNAKALIFAGLFFDGPEARRWRNKGFAILRREVPEQILPDGGQFELSPMYHALALEDMLDLINLTRRFDVAPSPREHGLVSIWAERIGPMIDWLHTMCHPDGEIALFNDAAMGIAPAPAEIFAYAERLGLTGTGRRALWLENSGYVRLEKGGAVVLADLARVGPDYLPGHAHADSLSFEMSLHGQRVFVNSGTSVYGTGPERLRQRGTSAHNTVLVAGQNSSEVWGGFRVARRARVFDVQVTPEGNALLAAGAHDGYCRLPGKLIHRRNWRLGHTSLEIDDSLAPVGQSAEARFHLHPEVQISTEGTNHGKLILASGDVLSWSAEGDVARIETITWHPQFGVSLPNRCLVLPLQAGQAKLRLTWE